MPLPLPALPLGKRCIVAPVCAPRNERKGGREAAWEALAPPVGVFCRPGLVLEPALQ